VIFLKKYKTNEEFIEELLSINPTITPLQSYMLASQPILCKCNICGLLWNVRPNNLLHGHGCPACAIKKQTKTNDDFIKEIGKIAPNIELISNYKGARLYVTVKCNQCGNIWETLPTNLLKGRNCPECAKNNCRIKKDVQK